MSDDIKIGKLCFSVGSETQSISFNIKNIIQSASITPNPTQGQATLLYTLNELTPNQIKISAVHSITGIEHLSILTTPVSLNGSLPINVNQLAQCIK